VYAFYATSIIADHLTTNLGQFIFGLTEANYITNFLIHNGLWILYDFAFFLISISIIYYIKEKKNFFNENLLFFPLFVGILRSGAAFNNILLMLKL
jgi:ABC-type transport system involved in multi-copper enzyme maturation permease subunit